MDDQELRDRALKSLLRALQEAGPELSHRWVVCGDADLDGLRDNETWRTLVRRLSRPDEPGKVRSDKPHELAGSARIVAEAAIAADAVTQPLDALLAARSAEGAPDTVTRPESPLRPAAFRQLGWWLTAFALTMAAFFVVVVGGWPWPLTMVVAVPLFVLAVRAGHRAFVARKERWPELTTTRPSQPKARPAPKA